MRDPIAYLHSFWELNQRTRLGKALRLVLERHEEVQPLREALERSETVRNELARMHAELSAHVLELEAARTRDLKTYKAGVREIAEIVWDTSAKSSDRIRRLQEQCTPREYLEQLTEDETP